MDAAQPSAELGKRRTPAVTRAALLALDALGRPIISLHAKRTYRILASGACELGEEQAALLNMGEEPDELPESDVVPHKAATDLIILASACAPRGGKVAQMIASIESLPVSRRFLIHGDRRVLYRGSGSIAFSDPEPFERMPLRYEHAYGGVDPYVSRPDPTTLIEALAGIPGIYPRNPAGRGYVVHENAELLERLRLPNIEDPSQPLTAATLVSGGQDRWWRMPQPWSCDWFDKCWYPRSLYIAGVPDSLPEDDSQVAEVRRGYAPGRSRARFRESDPLDLVDARCGDAASPGFVVPFMRGDERIRLRGMTPSGDFVVSLPGERPRMQIVFERRRIELEPLLNRVVVSLDEMGAYLVWHAGFVLPHSIPSEFGAQELPIEAFIDGQPATLFD